jgi:transposase
MYIRRTSIKNKKADDQYFTYRLVESHRVDGKVKQRTLLNLGRYFNVSQEHWALLTSRIEQLLNEEKTLFPIELTISLEKEAQRIVSKLHERGYGESELPQNFQTVDIDSLELNRPRKVGIEQIALHALEQLQLPNKLKELGFNHHQLAAAIGNIIARIAYPASENASYHWLQQQSGLGELIGYDYERMGHDRLYRASDLLWKHKDAIETHLYQQERSLFSLEETVTLYDLTNTFFEGNLTNVNKAKHGRSKEKRSDCPLVTLALVLDSSGFPSRSRHFAGNVSESGTLEEMLNELGVSKKSTIIMDAGIATEENVLWLTEHDYYYLVVSRKQHRQFDSEEAMIVKDESGQMVKAQRIENKEAGEVLLYCHSEAREQKEQAMQDKAKKRFEEALNSLHNGLSKKGTTKKVDLIQQRIGRLKQKYSRVAQHYCIDITENDGKAIGIVWKQNKKPGSQATHPGVYCLRSNRMDWDEIQLWKTYTMLTNLESVFKSLKSELGMRPVFHQKEKRIDAHIFITLLGYHLVHVLRMQLKTQGINDSWESLRCLMENRQRVTIKMKRDDGKTLHIRKTTRVEPHQAPILKALGLSSQIHPTTLMLS